jgi:hypothetical protein
MLKSLLRGVYQHVLHAQKSDAAYISEDKRYTYVLSDAHVIYE